MKAILSKCEEHVAKLIANSRVVVLSICISLSLFSAEFYTLIPNGAIHGIGKGTFWSVGYVFIIGYAKLYVQFGSKSFAKSLALSNSLYFGSISCAQVRPEGVENRLV